MHAIHTRTENSLQLRAVICFLAQRDWVRLLTRGMVLYSSFFFAQPRAADLCAAEAHARAATAHMYNAQARASSRLCPHSPTHASRARTRTASPHFARHDSMVAAHELLADSNTYSVWFVCTRAVCALCGATSSTSTTSTRCCWMRKSWISRRIDISDTYSAALTYVLYIALDRCKEKPHFLDNITIIYNEILVYIAGMPPDNWFIPACFLKITGLRVCVVV